MNTNQGVIGRRSPVHGGNRQLIRLKGVGSSRTIYRQSPKAVSRRICHVAAGRNVHSAYRASAVARLDEYDLAILRRSLTINGHHVPAGTTVTVLLRHPNGAAYEVELAAPITAVVTLHANELSPVR